MRQLARVFGFGGSVIAFGLCAVPPANAQADAVTLALIERTAQANFAEFFEMLALPNDSINAGDIARNADWLHGAGKYGSAPSQ
jgi:hypothetical protein